MRSITKVLILLCVLLVGFNLGRCSRAPLIPVAEAKVEQPKPRPPLPAYQPGLESQVFIQYDNGSCSGYIHDDYVLATATHCMEGSEIVGIATYGSDFKVYKESGRIIANDGADHVLVRVTHKLKGRHAKIVPVPPPGSPVYVWGNPTQYRELLRIGYVAGQHKDSEGVLYDVYDIRTFHGDSGTPIFDRDGNVVGMMHGYFYDTNPSNGVNFVMQASLPFAFSPFQLGELSHGPAAPK